PGAALPGAALPGTATPARRLDVPEREAALPAIGHGKQTMARTGQTSTATFPAASTAGNVSELRPSTARTLGAAAASAMTIDQELDLAFDGPSLPGDALEERLADLLERAAAEAGVALP